MLHTQSYIADAVYNLTLATFALLNNTLKTTTALASNTASIIESLCLTKVHKTYGPFH
jgi:hypothetical protein